MRCRSTILEQGLGWSLPPSASVVAAQLAALGSRNAKCKDKQTSQVLEQPNLPRPHQLVPALVVEPCGKEPMPCRLWPARCQTSTRP